MHLLQPGAAVDICHQRQFLTRSIIGPARQWHHSTGNIYIYDFLLVLHSDCGSMWSRCRVEVSAAQSTSRTEKSKNNDAAAKYPASRLRYTRRGPDWCSRALTARLYHAAAGVWRSATDAGRSRGVSDGPGVCPAAVAASSVSHRPPSAAPRCHVARVRTIRLARVVSEIRARRHTDRHAHHNTSLMLDETKPRRPGPIFGPADRSRGRNSSGVETQPKHFVLRRPRPKPKLSPRDRSRFETYLCRYACRQTDRQTHSAQYSSVRAIRYSRGVHYAARCPVPPHPTHRHTSAPCFLHRVAMATVFIAGTGADADSDGWTLRR